MKIIIYLNKLKCLLIILTKKFLIQVIRIWATLLLPLIRIRKYVSLVDSQFLLIFSMRIVTVALKPIKPYLILTNELA
jgi:hypothetical protein